MSKTFSVYVNSDSMGSGETELGERLITLFFKSLVENNMIPENIIFVNSGVFLTTGESETLDYIRKLEDNGSVIYSCGTCLDFYEKRSDLKIGHIGNMKTTAEILVKADKIITP